MEGYTHMPNGSPVLPVPTCEMSQCWRARQTDCAQCGKGICGAHRYIFDVDKRKHHPIIGYCISCFSELLDITKPGLQRK